MRIFLGLLGIAASYCLLRYRQQVGDILGEADWMRKVGGVYNVVILCAVLAFFWSISYMFGTTNVLFGPLTRLLPGMNGAGMQ